MADVLRGGSRTRAHADFVAFKGQQREEPAAEWAGYVAGVCLALGCDSLDPLEPASPPVAADEYGLPVTYHAAEMNDRPYVVARVGQLLGGPSAVLLLADPAGSALDRLADVLRARTASRCCCIPHLLDRHHRWSPSIDWILHAVHHPASRQPPRVRG